VTPSSELQAEARIRGAFDSQDLRTAATLLLELYGAEIYGFLVARLRSSELAAEVFSDFTEDLWRGIGSFRWVCSSRAWAYTLARHAASRAIRRRKRAPVVSLSRAGPLSEIADRIRVETAAALKTETRDRFVQLRQQLPLQDQMLLMLRVNRELPWLDIARIMGDGSNGGALPPQSYAATATRLRKRFQKAKEKLRKMAEEAGLLAD
jgi:RNA polymerase sigma-70 factor (ECF subfamily)